MALRICTWNHGGQTLADKVLQDTWSGQCAYPYLMRNKQRHLPRVSRSGEARIYTQNRFRIWTGSLPEELPATKGCVQAFVIVLFAPRILRTA